MRWLFKSDFRSFYLLNATQFLGALNDNIFKLLVVYLFIFVKGATAAPAVLALAGAIFVIPFLLFSSGSGVLADKISKRTIIVITKVLELVIMLFAVLSVYLHSEIGAFTCLFFMGAQSALFGPSKYGIIPELVEEKKVSKANGSMTSFTYLAIILGTFLASFITDITNKNFVLESMFCVLIAIAGLGTSLGISKTAPQRSTKKINPFFLYEIYQTLKASWKVPHLLPAIFSDAFFLFIGAYTQLNIIPFAMQSLHLSEVGGGYLFLATAVGIAIGAVVAGQLSKDRVEPGISCIAGFFIALFFFTLSIFSTSLICTIISLALLGIAGGGFLIPFDSYIQVNAPDEKRGQVIAATNFFSFVGVLMAAFCLYLFSEELGFTASSGFTLMGFLALFANIIITGRLSALFLPFFVQKILKRFRQLEITSPSPSHSDLIILQSNSWWDAILLFAYLPRLKILLPDRYLRHFPWFNGLVDSIQIVPPETKLRHFLEKAKKFQEKNNTVCLFFHRKKENTQIIEAYKKAFGRFHYKLCFAEISKEKTSKRLFFFRFPMKKIKMSFSRKT
jgi:acyl-[acyl-carrier-protein]-phospholipid O-acyltransferase / long-chain-fatty-acid--[acyl-carrier-protein] ligase